MASIPLRRKLEILSDAAKYDASCASSGGAKRSSKDGRGIGSTDSGMGVCHAFTPDGRCVSLLKILLTNFCVFDCAYCVNRVSSNVARARFSVEEVVQLTLDFYKRNYIEGLFLSSGVIRSADFTQEELNRVAKTLREVHDFRGYIHLKLVAGCSPELAVAAGLYADRLSVNIELPSDDTLKRLAPEKSGEDIKRAMGAVRLGIDDSKDQTHTGRKAAKFSPAGQSTQMIVGADACTDADILTRSESLYGGYGLKRVYYSAFSPIPDASQALPLSRPPLMREHRLYQADWLMRYYGFSRTEIASAAPDGMLDLERDPKLMWALANRDRFPVDVNRAEREMLLRIPGLGARSVDTLIGVRRVKAIRLEDLQRLARSVKRLQPFVITADWRPGAVDERLAEVAPPVVKPVQLSLF
ncbi:putative DNA modification/repair radical SAM protein [Caulobacter sp. S45]|uniref:putative DNA modification/repair radical SAM protein n=1 Tax=Caulobacter sp. S45 TaxID=1641861 RepID=UPI00157580F5|nr:putative DNA modification/repair radical SAM protein [Caulobacter sp. S45]